MFCQCHALAFSGIEIDCHSNLTSQLLQMLLSSAAKSVTPCYSKTNRPINYMFSLAHMSRPVQGLIPLNHSSFSHYLLYHLSDLVYTVSCWMFHSRLCYSWCKIHMGYWPSVRSRWLDIGQVIFLCVYGLRCKETISRKEPLKVVQKLWRKWNFPIFSDKDYKP